MVSQQEVIQHTRGGYLPGLSEPFSVNLRQRGVSDNQVESIKKMYNDNEFHLKRGQDEVIDTDKQTSSIT